MKRNINLSSIFAYALSTFAIVLAVFTASTMLKASTSAQEKTVQSFFGRYFFVVLSGSMEEEFPVGSLIITKEVDVQTIEEGDIISFVSIDPYYIDEVVSHKIRSVIEYEGELAFETYGTTTGISDSYPALASKVLGEYQATIPYIGNAIVFVQGEYGFLVCIILPLTIFFACQVVKLVKEVCAVGDDAARLRNRDGKHYKKP